jgi:hypothetical protein
MVGPLCCAEFSVRSKLSGCKHFAIVSVPSGNLGPNLSAVSASIT